MVKIEIIKVEDLGTTFKVEYEYCDTRERDGHIFPKNNGWESIEYNDKPKWLNHIINKIKKECGCKKQTLDNIKQYEKTIMDIDEEDNFNVQIKETLKQVDSEGDYISTQRNS